MFVDDGTGPAAAGGGPTRDATKSALPKFPTFRVKVMFLSFRLPVYSMRISLS